jgi:hypothetical protein
LRHGLHLQAVAMPSGGEWRDGAFPVLDPRGFYSTSGECSVSPFTTTVSGEGSARRQPEVASSRTHRARRIGHKLHRSGKSDATSEQTMGVWAGSNACAASGCWKTISTRRSPRRIAWTRGECVASAHAVQAALPCSERARWASAQRSPRRGARGRGRGCSAPKPPGRCSRWYRACWSSYV